MTVRASSRDRRTAAGRRRAAPLRREGAGLRAPQVDRSFLSGRVARSAVSALAVGVLVAWFAWYAATPDELPLTDTKVDADGVVGTPLYVGMFAAPDDFDRTIRIAGVKVHTTADVELTVTPLLCRRGTVGVTTQPDQFCGDLVDPRGQRLVGGDSIVLKVESEQAALAVIDRIRIAYREDLRWDTQPAGSPQAIVTLADRPAAAR